ncbi:MAG TPA: ABC transporter ATP-binding protein [Gaiellaceae bacterium]|nr:ABC transporter ATP-binding protein [Gaiellaceae bacterium]
MLGEIRIAQLTKAFGEVVAVDNIDLDMPPGEFFTMLGPSGCGKTTTLRMIAGFERPTSGQILLDGSDVAQVPPHKRSVNTVFQSYALFPHLDVAGNVAFGLKYRKLTKEERRRQVAEVLELVQLTGFEHRKPSQLSGGQQQRVALARALILTPRVLLLDEPLGALDARLRKDLQVELKALQRDIGVTFVFVTHDQEEALTMSDRLAVMRNGHVEQAGSPRDVYEQPKTTFVADFLGVSNLLEVESIGPDGNGCALRLGERMFRAEQGDTTARGQLKAMIRPERIVVEKHKDGADGDNRLPGMVEHAVFLGGSYEVHVRIVGGEILKVTVANEGSSLKFGLDQGTPVTLHLPPDALRVLEPDPEPPPEPSEEDAEAEPAAV